MHDFRSPSFFQGRRLRPCFNGVDAPAIYSVFGSRVGFRRRRIEWRYLRLEQMYVGENNARGVIRLVTI